jgi:DNA-binding IclR family transcriptional regulator
MLERMSGRKRSSEEEARPKYSAPALEKGLDILELLSAESAPMSLAQIGQRLERTSGEIFRMLAALERRGYLVRGPRPEQYVLTHKIYELAHRHPPTKRLLACALPEMEVLARAVSQSCHLAVRHGEHALIVAQVDCPGFTGFAVRVGAQAPLTESCSGRVLLAFQAPEVRKSWLDGCSLSAGARGALEGPLELLRGRGWNRQESNLHPGIVDFGAPVPDHEGRALAALTVPRLGSVQSATDESRLIAQLRAAAAKIAECLGAGAPPQV